MFATETKVNPDNLSILFSQALKDRGLGEIKESKYCLIEDKLFKIISEEPRYLNVQSKGSLKVSKVGKNQVKWVYIPLSLEGYCNAVFSQ